MSMQSLSVLTIGHSTHTVQIFVGLLRKHGVTALADVRSAPFSRFNPQFNKDALERDLKAQRIKYVFLGRELGARSVDPACYENGRVQYARIAQTAVFQSGLDRVMDGARKYRLALMCAEKEPLECHRTLLVARALVERGVAVEHILADGSLESHDGALTRLLELVGLPRQDLFRGRQQLIDEGLARQEERVAFVEERLAAEPRRVGR
ncbi:MAG: DUF488 domain-containing protein [Phycisphaerales bacterium]